VQPDEVERRLQAAFDLVMGSLSTAPNWFAEVRLAGERAMNPA
jgi:hypothetical protein